MFHVKRLERKGRSVLCETFGGKGKKQVFHVKRLERKREKCFIWNVRKKREEVDVSRETFGEKERSGLYETFGRKGKK